MSTLPELERPSDISARVGDLALKADDPETAVGDLEEALLNALLLMTAAQRYEFVRSEWAREFEERRG